MLATPPPCESHITKVIVYSSQTPRLHSHDGMCTGVPLVVGTLGHHISIQDAGLQLTWAATSL